ncbi:unnamed protein product [Meganyctiphanes norvegica]|uniref:Uncharacterized protein n=1 Tax=Meganyctiphanes norvegica TaxID=48144 RepID=A0AAV2Q6Y6_MEGNR
MDKSEGWDSSMINANTCTPFIGEPIGISNGSSSSIIVHEKGSSSSSSSILPDISQFSHLCMIEEQTAQSSTDKVHMHEDVKNRPANTAINNMHINGECWRERKQIRWLVRQNKLV